jgi:hypothetical protein
MNEKQQARARASVVAQWTRLLRSLKKNIADDYRAGEDEDIPGMCVTFGLGEDQDGALSWSYQTGDNSFTGGAYGFSAWGVVSLYRRSNSRELAEDAFSQAFDAMDGGRC